MEWLETTENLLCLRSAGWKCEGQALTAPCFLRRPQGGDSPASPLLLVVAGNPGCSLGGSCIPPVTVPSSQGCLPSGCVCLNPDLSFLVRAPVTGFSHPNPALFHLYLVIYAKTLFLSKGPGIRTSMHFWVVYQPTDSN